MHRFHLPAELCRGDELVLDGSEAHHAIHVLRLSAGERVAVLDGAGHEVLCEVLEARGDRVRLAQRQRTVLPSPACRLTLIQAITKGKSMELIVQKATELGAHRIVPVLSERSVPRIEDGESDRKVEKWGSVAVEAMKQCGSPWLPSIEKPLSPSAFLNRGEKFDLHLLASLQPGCRHPREYFRSFEDAHGRRPGSVAVWVGPEGDFTPAELNTVTGAGALPITLGPLVLRSETAAIYCLSVISYELTAPG